MSRAVAAALAVAVAAGTGMANPAPLRAQSAGSPQRGETSALVRHGKWVALGLAAAATAAGVGTHEAANHDYDRLRGFCMTSGPCDLAPDGRYASREAEALYREVIRGDRRARVWFAAAQVALVGTVALWVLDLRNRGYPKNEPLSGLVLEPGGGRFGGARIGWRVALP